MTHDQIIKALNSLRPGTEWTLVGDDYADLVWLSSGKPPTSAEIEKEITDAPARQAALEATKADAKADLLARLGITEDEARLLLS